MIGRWSGCQRRWLAGGEAVFLDVRLMVEACAWTVGRSSGCQFLACRQAVCLDGSLAVGVVCLEGQAATGSWSGCLLEWLAGV